jgi:hypothetical protein
MHGGSAPQVRAAAERRILEAADPAAAKLVHLMRDPKVPPQVQLAAARDLLDRAGLAKTTELQIALKPYQQDIGGLIVEVDDFDPTELARIIGPRILSGEVGSPEIEQP